MTDFFNFIATIFIKELQSKNLLKFSSDLTSLIPHYCVQFELTNVKLYDILFVTNGIVQSFNFRLLR